MGIQELRAAAQRGDAAALYRLAVYEAEGIGGAPDLNGALHRLRDAAARGYRPAQADLAALAGDWGLAGEIAAGKNLPAEASAPLRARRPRDLAELSAAAHAVGGPAHRDGRRIFAGGGLRLADRSRAPGPEARAGDRPAERQ